MELKIEESQQLISFKGAREVFERQGQEIIALELCPSDNRILYVID